MTPLAVLLMLLQLCSFQLVLVAMPTCTLQANVVEESYRHLKELGPRFPIHCLQYNANISFPDSAFNSSAAHPTQCRRALWVVYETLRGMSHMIRDNDLPLGEGGVSWDEEKFDMFQNLQYRLLTDGSCLSRAEDPGVFSSYFRNVTDVLQQQESAPCGWMALRRDVCRVLEMALHEHHKCFA